jgi:hypothetical protein
MLSLILASSGDDMSTMSRHWSGLWGLGIIPFGLQCSGQAGNGVHTLAASVSFLRYSATMSVCSFADCMLLLAERKGQVLLLPL